MEKESGDILDNVSQDSSSHETSDSFEIVSDNEEIGRNRMFSVYLLKKSKLVQLRDEGNLKIKLNNKSILRLEWLPMAREKCFNEKEAANFIDDELMSGKHEVDYVDCLKLYTGEEKLGADNAWYCPKCEKPQEATKKMDIWNLPKVLIIHLKRFSCDQNSREKIKTFVTFPIQGLDLSDYVISSTNSEAKYDLIAVCNHQGNQTSAGHYTACGKNKLNGNWYFYDDAVVTKIDEKDVVTEAAYLLFYQRRSQYHGDDPSPIQHCTESGYGEVTEPVVVK